MTALRFVAVGPRGERRERALDARAPIWLGRDPGCAFVLDDPGVSRRHVSIHAEEGRLTVTDRSSNGTRVDGDLLHRSSRRVGASAALELGPYRIEVSAPDSPAKKDASAVAPRERSVDLRRRVHRLLLDHLDLARLDPRRMDRAALEPKVRAALARICDELRAEAPTGQARDAWIDELTDEALGLGPLEGMLLDPSVSEIMVVDPSTIYVERRGMIEPVDRRFTDAESVRAVIERIVTPLGRRIDESTPLVDARLPDGSRVNAIIPPLARRGPCITIRKFATTPLTLDDLVARGSLADRMAVLLTRAVQARKNIVISGGTGSGKTTLLNVLSAAIPERERIVTIEDAAELRLHQAHVVALEARPANLEGKGAYSIRDLVRNALRMRPDRIVVGECRGGEAIDMLQAMNTGHEGSMTTTHANSPEEAIARLETLCLMAGLDLPIAAIRHQIASSIHLIVQQARFADGTRRVTSIGEIAGVDDHGEVTLHEIFAFERTGTRADGTIEGRFRATGYLPSFVGDFITQGLVHGEEYL